MTAPRIAVLVPCYNEEAAIAKVVHDFKAALPDSIVYVYDNNSKDQTIARATEAGAVVRSEYRQGKGNVVRRMFADIEADVYLMIDGDDTYDSVVAPQLVKQLIDGSYDIVAGQRIATASDAYRAGHVLGNKLLTGLTSIMFNVHLKDMLTGYRVFSRRFVKSFPFTAEGFGIETELTVHAVRLFMPMVEVPTKYKERPPGSISKLSTYKDGFKILFTITSLVREERPLIFFSGIFALLALLSLGLGIPLILEYLHTHLVPRFPTAILAVGMMVLAFLSLAVGFILDTVTRGRWEAKRMAYLAIPGPQDLRQPWNELFARLSQSRFLRFLIVGGFGFLVSEAVLLTVHAAGANTTVAWFAAFAGSVTFTWWGNRNLTFGDRKATGASGILVEYGKFVASNALGGAVNFAVFKASEMYAPAPLNKPFVALAFGVLAGLVFNFTLSRLVVFRSGSPTR